MPVNALKEYLDTEQVKYVCIVHSPAYTAQEIAACVHISGKEIAKTVIVKKDKILAMIVLPADHQIDFKRLSEELRVPGMTLAKESEFKNAFPGCELGAMPPFGSLYGMEVFVATSLLNDEKIAFNAGSHAELIQLALEDYMKLAKPKLLNYN